MPTPVEIIKVVASLQNDTAQQRYTTENCLPYLNIALDELQEIFEENNIPVTNETSAAIEVDASVDAVGFGTTDPHLPDDLIEIQRLWESPRDLNQWTPLTKKEFLPHYLEDGTTISQFLIWAWIGQEIRLIGANADNDLKLDYVRRIFNTPLDMSKKNLDIPIINIKTYLGYSTGALCAAFIGEDIERAGMLEGKASTALLRTLGISTKGRQSIVTRRRPFRSSYKRSGGYIRM